MSQYQAPYVSVQSVSRFSTEHLVLLRGISVPPYTLYWRMPCQYYTPSTAIRDVSTSHRTQSNATDQFSPVQTVWRLHSLPPLPGSSIAHISTGHGLASS
eukprot:2321186-Rhodomonas_salina.7